MIIKVVLYLFEVLVFDLNVLKLEGSIMFLFFGESLVVRVYCIL